MCKALSESVYVYHYSNRTEYNKSLRLKNIDNQPKKQSIECGAIKLRNLDDEHNFSIIRYKERNDHRHKVVI